MPWKNFFPVSSMSSIHIYGTEEEEETTATDNWESLTWATTSWASWLAMVQATLNVNLNDFHWARRTCEYTLSLRISFFLGQFFFQLYMCCTCIFGATYGGLRSTCLLTSVIFRSMCGFFKRPRHLGFWALQHSKPQNIGPAWKSIDQGDPAGFEPGRWMLQTTPKLRWAVDGLNRFLSSVSRIWWKLFGFLSLKKFTLLKRSLVFEELSKNNLMWYVQPVLHLAGKKG